MRLPRPSTANCGCPTGGSTATVSRSRTSIKPYQWLPADKDIETFSPHVNLLAVLYDLAPKELQPAIVEKVLAQKPLNTQPWFMHWVFQAIDHAGLFDKYATPQMRRWRIVPETQSFHEMWNGGDLSHGWCSTPLVQMSGRVLGVTPTSPGFKTLAIRPSLGDLTWAKGIVPTPHGDIAVFWALGRDRLQMDVTVPDGTEADVTVPTARFEKPAIRLNGRSVGAVLHLTAGTHRFDVTGTLKPAATAGEEASTAEAGEDFEADLVKDDLVHRYLARSEDHCSHRGGGLDAGSLFNSTTRNGSGGMQTIDDGKTFRGYGKGDWLTLYLKQPCDLREVRSFAGHNDARASQHYTVLVAYAAEPGKFVKIASGSKPCDGGASELRVPLKADGVVAVRLEFQDGPLGFNVYREINVVGTLGGAAPADGKR